MIESVAKLQDKVFKVNEAAVNSQRIVKKVQTMQVVATTSSAFLKSPKKQLGKKSKKLDSQTISTASNAEPSAATKLLEAGKRAKNYFITKSKPVPNTIPFFFGL